MSGPTVPEARISKGSGTFLIFKRAPSTTTAMDTVTQSTNDRRARITTAPAMAPTAAAVTPWTNAFTCGLPANRR